MSKELKGKNGKVVGTMEYFDKLNEKCTLGYMFKKYNFNYYSSIKDISKKSEKMFDVVYNDLKNNEKYLSYIDKSDKKDTIKILEGMADLCKIVSGSTSGADKCISLLSKSDKSKSGASDSDVTKSAKFILSNKYFNKKDSLKIIEYYIKNGERKTLEIGKNVKEFLKEVVKSSRSGYIEDVLVKVNHLDSGKKITGKCGKVLCSREYNDYVANVVTNGAGAKGNVDYGRIVSQGIRYVVIELQKDLEYGLRNNDYIINKNKDNLIKFIEDVDKCGGKCYDLLKVVYELSWFVGGDTNKIIRLQKTLNKQGYSKVVQDGVYGSVTEEAWLDYVNKTLERYSSNNWVVGIGGYRSAHGIVGKSEGRMIYIDDDFNIVIMETNVYGVTSDFGVSVGITMEKSKTAGTVYDMAGKSVSYSASASTPSVNVGASVGQSRSFGNGEVVTNSFSGYIGASASPVDVSGGVAVSTIKYDFNPKEWLMKKLQARK